MFSVFCINIFIIFIIFVHFSFAENLRYGGAIPIAPSFHTDARDAKSREEMFNQQVLFNDKQELARQLNAGVCKRIRVVSNMLNNTISPESSEERIVEDASQPDEICNYETNWILSSIAQKYL